mmetsp:Transcript_91258/g.181429  ORF Transcript_91258/g.181429 Transcript_91258/m.181429 type:complete len:149 (-) Transcript_91258:61-507(-)
MQRITGKWSRHLRARGASSSTVGCLQTRHRGELPTGHDPESVECRLQQGHFEVGEDDGWHVQADPLGRTTPGSVRSMTTVFATSRGPRALSSGLQDDDDGEPPQNPHVLGDAMLNRRRWMRQNPRDSSAPSRTREEEPPNQWFFGARL